MRAPTESGQRPIPVTCPLRTLSYGAHPRVHTSTHIIWRGPCSTLYSPRARGHHKPRPQNESGVWLPSQCSPKAPKHGAVSGFWSPRGLQSPDPWLKLSLTSLRGSSQTPSAWKTELSCLPRGVTGVTLHFYLFCPSPEDLLM